jgi:hypothetical protein
MIEFLAALGALGLWFWALAAVVILAAVISVENEKFTVTTPVVVVGIAALIWLSKFDVFGWARHNMGTIAIAIAVYLSVGVLYGVVRYMFYVHKVADKLDTYAHRYGYNTKALTKKQASDFALNAGLRNFPMKVADSKGRITFWMIYWPFSAPWTLINEPVTRFFNFAYGRIAGLLQGIANRAFRGVTIVEDEPVLKSADREIKGLTNGRVQLNG